VRLGKLSVGCGSSIQKSRAFTQRRRLCFWRKYTHRSAGLSSSAALENGFAFGLNELFRFGESPMSLVKMSQKAEHEYP